MLKNLIALMRKYKEQLMYLVFGALTTLISWAGYWLLYEVSGMRNVPATIISELVAITFAFVTNKLWVFESKSWRGKPFYKEVQSFYACRALAFFLKLGFMYLTVDILLWHAMLMQVLITVVVIVVNYFASKFFVFAKK